MRVAAAVSVVLSLLAVCRPVNAAAAAADEPGRRPNVLVIITDDQGYGDLACNGNPIIRTPHLDQLAKESVRLTNFYVSPVCSPTRASLLTGRYNYRTGVVDTFLGRSMMHTDEVTLAEMLRWAGYRTGIFGKWHLGDNYPMRPMDQGFGESLVHKGGGLSQPSDIGGVGSYFDPVLLRNGRPVKANGYVSDVLATATIDFINTQHDKPFFAYLAFNAPHDPLTEVPQQHYDRYKSLDLAGPRFNAPGWPLPKKLDADKTARVYAMVSNIDDNVGRVLAKLKELDLERDTIVVFLTDNGPAFPRFNAGMRGLKGTPYDGGVHVPCFMRWPAGFGAASGAYVDRVAAHIDVTPTLLDGCRIPQPPGIKFDGVSLLPLLRGDVSNDTWPERSLFLQWHRGDAPQPERAYAVRSQRWKLVQPNGTSGGEFQPDFQLYDLAAEKAETRNVAQRNLTVVDKLNNTYRMWFDDVTAPNGRKSPRIVVGTPHENPSVLTRQDWRGPRAGWKPTSLGHWDVQVADAGEYEVTVHPLAEPTTQAPASAGASADAPADAPQPQARLPRTVHLRIGDAEAQRPLESGQKAVKFPPMRLPAGPAKVEAWVTQGEETLGVRDVEVLNVAEPIS